MISVRTGGALRPRLIDAPLLVRALAVGLSIGALVVSVAAVVSLVSSVRLVVAVLLATALTAVALRWPVAAAALTICCLPLLGLIRRLLIPVAGWTSYDPLLVISSVVAVVVLVRSTALSRRAFSSDVTARLVTAVGVLTLLELGNPLAGAIDARFESLLYVFSPLLWFFIGRSVVSSPAVRTILATWLLLGTAIAAYGLGQTQVGFPPWDADWIALNGYGALVVGGSTRAFGTLASNAEYAVVMGCVVAFGVAMLRRSHWLTLGPVGLAATALVYSSSRSALVLTTLALILMFAISAGGGRRLAWPLLALTVLTVVGLSVWLGPAATQVASATENPLLRHQLSGVVDPFNSSSSTLTGHGQEMLAAINDGVSHPLGQGPAATNVAQGTSSTAEVDFGNAFVDLGPAGGLLYAALILVILAKVIRAAAERRDAVTLAATSVLIIAFTQWLNGGYYAVAPLVWLLIGWLTRPTKEVSSS